MQNLVVIENAVIDQLLADKRFQEQFPEAMQLVQTPPADCDCPGKVGQLPDRNAMYLAMKRYLAGLGFQGRNRVKALLDTRQVRIVLQTGKGGTKHITY